MKAAIRKSAMVKSAFGNIHELPGALPEGEHVLWQGAPSWWALARSLHIRLVATYMVALLAWYTFDTLWQAGPRPAVHVARMTGIAVFATGLFAAYAFLVCCSTSYTFTNRRLILQTGIALPISFNIPFCRIVSAELKQQPDGSGDIALALEAGDKIGYLAVWPHARPWRLSRVQPMLRAVSQAGAVAKRLAHLVDAENGSGVRLHATAVAQPGIGYATLPDGHMVAAE